MPTKTVAKIVPLVAKPAATAAQPVATTTKPYVSPKPVITKAAVTPVATKAPAPAVTKAPVATKAPAPAAKTYANCTALNQDYPHGVGKAGAVDHTSGSKPVTNFTVNNTVYSAQTGSDRDKDGIACEKL